LNQGILHGTSKNFCCLGSRNGCISEDGGGFEFDNVTVASTVQSVNTSLVHVSGPTTVTKGASTKPSLSNTGSSLLPLGVTGFALLAVGATIALYRIRRSDSNNRAD
jgi:hypothetical protein